MKNIFDRPLAFVDIETTGGSHLKSRVLEVGVVRVEGNQVVATYQSLVQPEELIPAFITSLTGITNSDVEDAPHFAQISDQLAEVLDGAVFVAHNVGFDYGFLKMEFERLGAVFAPDLLCTVRLSRRLFPQYRTHKLQDLILRHGLTAPARHRAYDDAHCLWQFYQIILGEFDLDTIEEAVRAQLSSKALPSHLDMAQVAVLPDGPGVYVFEDDDGGILYVGKSVGVKRRVMGHFAAGYHDAKEQRLAQLVKRLRGIATHGELSALLLESQMIQELQPRYNRALRRREHVSLVVLAATEDGYSSVSLVEASEVDPDSLSTLLGVYTTPAVARQSLQTVMRDFRLCPKLLGLERTNGACFLAQLGKCNKACTGDEPIFAYNDRFLKAFSSHRIDAWPYRGAVLIREQYTPLGGSVGFVVDGWCIIARLTEYEDGTVEPVAETRRFDLAKYHIIRRFIGNARNKRLISPLSPSQLSQIIEQ